MPLLSEVQERSWATDKYGDKVLLWKFDWRHWRVMDWINNFVRITGKNTYADVERQNAKRTGNLKRSLAWKTWAMSGGDAQVFDAQYIYYSKFIELAVGRGEPLKEKVPPIPGRNWAPIPVPSRRRKGRPHVVTEMRSQAQKFTSFVAGQLSFAGTVYMLFAMGNNKAAAAAYNRALQWLLQQGKTTR